MGSEEKPGLMLSGPALGSGGRRGSSTKKLLLHLWGEAWPLLDHTDEREATDKLQKWEEIQSSRMVGWTQTEKVQINCSSRWEPHNTPKFVYGWLEGRWSISWWSGYVPRKWWPVATSHSGSYSKRHNSDKLSSLLSLQSNWVLKLQSKQWTSYK